ncbi:MAG: ester cyclase [Chloroflexia bacterium]
MSDIEKMAIVRRYFTDLWNRGDLDVADALIAPGFGGAGVMPGPEAAKLYVSSYRSAFPNIQFRILSLQCQDDLVMACWVGTGAHEPCSDGPDAAIVGDDRTMTGLSVYRLENGKIAEMWIGAEAAQALANESKRTTHSSN